MSAAIDFYGESRAAGTIHLGVPLVPHVLSMETKAKKLRQQGQAKCDECTRRIEDQKNRNSEKRAEHSKNGKEFHELEKRYFALKRIVERGGGGTGITLDYFEKELEQAETARDKAEEEALAPAKALRAMNRFPADVVATLLARLDEMQSA